MATPWNLTATQWSDVLLKGTQPDRVASVLARDRYLPWTDILLNLTDDASRILDLGSGRGELSAILALRGKRTTLLDWSDENLRFSSTLFQGMGLPAGFCRADMMKPLPFKTNAFDVVFSCGVFEYFTPGQIRYVLHEAFRVSRKRVIIMVPNALSIAYRIGKWYMERTGAWHWGGEIPSYTLRPYFRHTPARRVSEFSVAAKHSLSFLTMPFGGRVRDLLTSRLGLSDHSNPSWLRQGYLLITVGEKSGALR